MLFLATDNLKRGNKAFVKIRQQSLKTRRLLAQFRELSVAMRQDEPKRGLIEKK
jgi:hypothetical protein